MKYVKITSVYALMVGLCAPVFTGCAEDAGGDGTGTGTMAGQGGMAGTGAPVAGAAGTTAPVAGASGSPVSVGAPGEGLPCAVASIVQERCQGCHAATPLFGSRMPLLNQADFQRALVSDPTRRVYERAIELINATMGVRMPPAPSPALPAAELDAMNAWLTQGAQASAETCGAPIAGEGGVGGPVAGEGGVGPVGGIGGEGGMGTVAPRPGETCYTLRANAGGGMGKYNVGIANDSYYNFFFQAPWTGMAYATSFKALTDNAEVVHHWLLFKEGAPATAPGTVAPSSGAHPGGELVHGWAPGGDDLIFPPEVGFEMPPVGYTLELHYNSTNPSAMDSSGVEVCVVTEPPENIASLSWLGTDAINGTSATGTCRPVGNQRIRLLGGTPHMHVAGTHMKVEINRMNGTKEVLHDDPFDFNFQVAYELDTWLEPGDTITTTCTYNRPSRFGSGTSDEMCYFFTLAYPKQALRDNGIFGSIAHGMGACLGM